MNLQALAPSILMQASTHDALSKSLRSTFPSIDSLLRQPTQGELEFFRGNGSVGGMATIDNRIVLNPYSSLSPIEQRAVANNERLRLLFRMGLVPRYSGSLTENQISYLDSNEHYASAPEEDRIETIISRLISSDPSAGEPNEEQSKFIEMLRSMGVFE